MALFNVVSVRLYIMFLYKSTRREWHSIASTIKDEGIHDQSNLQRNEGGMSFGKNSPTDDRLLVKTIFIISNFSLVLADSLFSGTDTYFLLFCRHYTSSSFSLNPPVIVIVLSYHQNQDCGTAGEPRNFSAYRFMPFWTLHKKFNAI